MDQVLSEIVELFPLLNDEQKRAIITTEGPLLLIAGPGTGKTLALVLRTLYIIKSGKAKPSEIVLTTFTEKAAFELRDRVSQISRKLKMKESLHELKIGTIHSICEGFISKNLFYSPLKNNYLTLDDLTQYLFIYEHFDEIVGAPRNDLYLGKWKTKWSTIGALIPFINKITEELINPDLLLESEDGFVKELGKSYKQYRKLLFENNRIDFSHLQSVFLDLLKNEAIGPKIKDKIKYIMVDEYQDTNYVQEQIILTWGKPSNNICVVGDEDQSLYRFRGATIRNIIEFPSHFNNCKKIPLLTNYRSHKHIIERYDRFMQTVDWADSDGKFYRFMDKVVTPPGDTVFPEYPAVFSIWGRNEFDEGQRVAEMIKYLKDKKVITDYRDVALILKSVRTESSGQYTNAFDRLGIPYFNPRAKAYFENDEIKMMLACFAMLFEFMGEHLENYPYRDYIYQGFELLKDYIKSPLSEYIQRRNAQITSLGEGQSLDLTVGDYFYQLLAYKPFSKFLKEEDKTRNLSIFSSLLRKFQQYYHFNIVTYRNKEFIKFYLFGSFFRFLIDGGIDEYEDPDNPFPKGHVQVMTIHQSKGLDFPVIIVGSLARGFTTQKQIDRTLGGYYARGLFEPEKRITDFDRARHFYVAFSRAQKLLVLTTTDTPHISFAPIWEGLDQWPHVKRELLAAQRFSPKDQYVPKRSFSLTSDINIYETCPRQYQMYREYKFEPSRVGSVLFGSLVHQTIEDIHRLVLGDRLDEITPTLIEELYNENYKGLIATGLRPLAKTPREAGLKQVITYFNQNKDLMDRVIETEVDVSVEKDKYIILGKIDLLLGKDNKVEILDFKTQPKPKFDDPLIERYKRQLSLYGYIVNQRYGLNPERLLLYWTSEESRENALMEFPYIKDYVDEVGKHFDYVSNCIMEKKFDIGEPPDTSRICKECDFKIYCSKEGIINFKSEDKI